MSEYVFALMDATAGYNGGQVRLTRGSVWDAEDPLVADHPDWFSETAPVVHNTTGKPAPVPQVGEKKAARRGRQA